MLGPCGVFDTNSVSYDYVTLPDGSRHGGCDADGQCLDCPAGAVLTTGGSVGWTSDSYNQGGAGRGGNAGLGGGWQICFAW